MVVRGEHRFRAELFRVGAVFEHRAGNGHAVVGGRAAPDLVKDEQGIGGRVFQYGRDLAHFDHKRRSAAREIVARADAREHAVADADRRAARRNERADLRHEHDDRRLAHIGAFTCHVRAGHDGDAVVGVVQVRVVRYEERIALHLLDDRVASLGDREGTRYLDLRADIVVAHRDLGERAECVELRERRGERLQLVHTVADAPEHVTEEVVFQRFDPLAGRGNVVLQLFELRREVPLAVYQRLLAYVFLRQLGRAGGVRHVDIIPEHLVVADLELFDAGALLFARLQLRDAFRAVVADAAQAVYLLAVAGAEDAALAHGERRLVTDGAAQQPAEIFQRLRRGDGAEHPAPVFAELCEDLRHGGEIAAEREHVAAVRRAVHGARGEPLDIADGLELFDELGTAHVVAEKLLHRGEPPPDGRRREQRPLHPAAEHASAHRGLCLIEHPEKAAALFAGAEIFRQLQIAPRRGVQLHIPAARENIRHTQLRHIAARRVREIGEQRAERERRHLVELGGVFAVLICDRLAGVFGIEPSGGGLHAAAEPLFERVADIAAEHRLRREHALARAEAGKLVLDVRRRVRFKRRRAHLAGRYVRKGASARLAAQHDGAEIVRLALAQHGRFHDRAGGDDAHDVARDEPLAELRVLHLFAHGDLVALGDELGDVLLRAVVRHAAHRRALVLGLAAVARRERKAELARAEDRVIVEHLVKIAQPVKEQAIGMLGLDGVILHFHGGSFCGQCLSPLYSVISPKSANVLLETMRAFAHEPMSDSSPRRWTSRPPAVRAESV